MKSEALPKPFIKQQRHLFIRLMAFDLGRVVDEDWNVAAGWIEAEDWGCCFSGPLRQKLSSEGRELYRLLMDEIRWSTCDLRYLWGPRNLGSISRRTKRLLREVETTDCITWKNRILIRKEAREGRMIDFMFWRCEQLEQERPGTKISPYVAGKPALFFISLDAIRKSLRTLPRFSKR
jgi:hypothetical protein